MKKNIKILLIISVLIIIITLIINIFNSTTKNKQDVELLIYPTENFIDIKNKLTSQGIISGLNSTFQIYSKIFKYPQNIKTGRYIIKSNTKIINLVKILRSGSQTPVKITINNARTVDDFAQKICKNLMITKADLINYIKNQQLNNIKDSSLSIQSQYQMLNFIFENIIPNTYEVYWNITPENLMNKLQKESDKFWNQNSKTLKEINLSKKEIIILASIVSEETNKKDEMPIIAGVYINRLNKNMFLQADPTVKFAVGDFSLKRILNKHLQIDSPFNTYKYPGLPPAPICLPNLDAIKSVIHYDKNSYLFFCAKEDFSGYHNFATTEKEHLKNANLYRKALNNKGIK